VLSVISYWEVILKSAKGNLDVGDPRAWWEIALGDFAATVMPYRDPFDRALIAQATVEDLVLVTTDEEIAHYASEALARNSVTAIRPKAIIFVGAPSA
jgi:PIN domain nuclease of toxin-antitoxin system